MNEDYLKYLKEEAIRYFGITEEDQKNEFLVDDLSKAIQYIVNAGPSLNRYDVLDPPKMTEEEAAAVIVDGWATEAGNPSGRYEGLEITMYKLPAELTLYAYAQECVKWGVALAPPPEHRAPGSPIFGDLQ